MSIVVAWSWNHSSDSQLTLEIYPSSSSSSTLPRSKHANYHIIALEIPRRVIAWSLTNTNSNTTINNLARSQCCNKKNGTLHALATLICNHQPGANLCIRNLTTFRIPRPDSEPELLAATFHGVCFGAPLPHPEYWIKSYQCMYELLGSGTVSNSHKRKIAARAIQLIAWSLPYIPDKKGRDDALGFLTALGGDCEDAVAITVAMFRLSQQQEPELWQGYEPIVLLLNDPIRPGALHVVCAFWNQTSNESDALILADATVPLDPEFWSPSKLKQAIATTGTGTFSINNDSYYCNVVPSQVLSPQLYFDHPREDSMATILKNRKECRLNHMYGGIYCIFTSNGVLIPTLPDTTTTALMCDIHPLNAHRLKLKYDSIPLSSEYQKLTQLTTQLIYPPTWPSLSQIDQCIEAGALTSSITSPRTFQELETFNVSIHGTPIAFVPELLFNRQSDQLLKQRNQQCKVTQLSSRLFSKSRYLVIVSTPSLSSSLSLTSSHRNSGLRASSDGVASKTSEMDDWTPEDLLSQVMHHARKMMNQRQYNDDDDDDEEEEEEEEVASKIQETTTAATATTTTEPSTSTPFLVSINQQYGNGVQLWRMDKVVNILCYKLSSNHSFNTPEEYISSAKALAKRLNQIIFPDLTSQHKSHHHRRRHRSPSLDSIPGVQKPYLVTAHHFVVVVSKQLWDQVEQQNQQHDDIECKTLDKNNFAALPLSNHHPDHYDIRNTMDLLRVKCDELKLSYVEEGGQMLALYELPTTTTASHHHRHHHHKDSSAVSQIPKAVDLVLLQIQKKKKKHKKNKAKKKIHKLVSEVAKATEKEVKKVEKEIKSVEQPHEEKKQQQQEGVGDKLTVFERELKSGLRAHTRELKEEGKKAVANIHAVLDHSTVKKQQDMVNQLSNL